MRPAGTGAYGVPPFWPPTRRAAGDRGRQPPGPLQPPTPAVRRNVVTRRPTGLARVARCAPKSPRVNFRQLRGAEGGFSRWRQGSLTDEDSNDRRSIAGRRKAPVPAGHYKSSPGDKPLASKNGAAEFTRRAVARALQEGTRARTSGGAARRGSDVGERQPDPGSPRLPEVRARRLLIQRSRRADVRGCRHEMDFRVISRRTSLLWRKCTLLVLDRNKRRCSTRR